MVKSTPKKLKRGYRAPRRKAQADATRDAILDAAHRLFLADGYSATSIRAVAEAAQVSDQTIYNVFGDKPSLLVAVGLRAVSGVLAPDATPGHDFESELRAAPGPRERVEVAAKWSRRVWEGGVLRFESMLLDAASDPRAAEIAASVWKRKVDYNRRLFPIAFPKRSLPAGDDFDEAFDLFCAIDSAAFVRILIDDRGWTFDRYERWVAVILRRLFTRLPG